MHYTISPRVGSLKNKGGQLTSCWYDWPKHATGRCNPFTTNLTMVCAAELFGKNASFSSFQQLLSGLSETSVKPNDFTTAWQQSRRVGVTWSCVLHRHLRLQTTMESQWGLCRKTPRGVEHLQLAHHRLGHRLLYTTLWHDNGRHFCLKGHWRWWEL